MKRIYTIIAAVSLDGKIGNDNDLLWHISEDLKRFKENTINQVLLMGLNTFKFLPEAAKKNRKFIILGKEKLLHDSILFQCDSLSELFNKLKSDEYSDITNILVAGGAMVYKTMLPFCDHALLTIVEENFPDANKLFPSEEFVKKFKLNEEFVYERSKENIIYSFRTYSRQTL